MPPRLNFPMRPIIIFDLDGTLADTAPDLIGTLNVLLDREGLPGLEVAEAGALIGVGARALLQRGFSAAGRDLAPDHLEALYADFLDHYGENLCLRTRLYPGTLAALETLTAAGFTLAVCTNKYEAHSLRLLEGLGIAERFAAICGRDTFPFFKPDPRHLLLTIERAGGDPAQAVMVGDSRTDIVTARAAGVPVIAVPFGYTEVPVDELGPDRIVRHFDELAAAVAELVAPARAA